MDPGQLGPVMGLVIAAASGLDSSKVDSDGYDDVLGTIQHVTEIQSEVGEQNLGSGRAGKRGLQCSLCSDGFRFV